VGWPGGIGAGRRWREIGKGGKIARFVRRVRRRVFMTLLGHNDAHCIVPHVKHTPDGDTDPSWESALARRPEIRERRPRTLSCVVHLPFWPSPRSALRVVFLSSPHDAPRAIKETNVNHGWLSLLNASTRLHRSVHLRLPSSPRTGKVGRDVSEREVAGRCSPRRPLCDERSL